MLSVRWHPIRTANRGHALFMLQRTARDDEASPSLDIPLSEKQLRQIVRFSVLPYVRAV